MYRSMAAFFSDSGFLLRLAHMYAVSATMRHLSSRGMYLRRPSSMTSYPAIGTVISCPSYSGETTAPAISEPVSP